MSTLALYTKIELLPEDLKKQVIDYIEFLLSRESKAQQIQTPESPKAKVNLSIGGAAPPPSSAQKPLKAGFLKGTFVMAHDFDEPLEDFKDYM